jgi:hypothetical protein
MAGDCGKNEGMMPRVRSKIYFFPFFYALVAKFGK